MTDILFASLDVPNGNSPVVNPNAVSSITTEGSGARVHMIDRPSLLISLSAAAAAAALGFTVVATPSDLVGASGPTLISVIRSGDTDPTLINPTAISRIEPTVDGGSTICLLVTAESGIIVSAASVSDLAGLIATEAVVSLARKGADSTSLLTRNQVATVVPFQNGHDGTVGAKLFMRDGKAFETATGASDVLTALTA